MKNKKIIKRLYRYVKPYRSRFIIAFISLVIVGGLTPSLIAIVKPVMDGIFTAQEKVLIPVINYQLPRENVLYYLAVIIIILTVLKGIFTFLSKYYMAYIGQNITKDFRNRIFRHLMFLSLSYYSTNPTGQLLSRVTNDVKYLETSIVKIPARLIRDGFQLIFLIFLIFYTNWQWAILSMIGFGIIIFPVSKFSDIMRKIGRTGHQRMADIYDFLSEKIAGIRLIKAFSMEKEEHRTMRKVNKKFVDIVLKSEKINAFQRAFIEFLSNAGVVAIIILGGKSVMAGEITPGDFFMFLGFLVGMYQPAKHFSSINQKLQRSFAAAERIFKILDHREHILQVENPKMLIRFRDKIEFKNVSFAYKDEDYVLEDLNFEIGNEDIVAFVGPSGAGKSTAINLLPRFFDPQKGQITIDGIDLKEYNIKSLRGKMSMVMQDIILFNMSVRENICYGLGDFSQEEVEKYARAAHAHEFIQELPDGYDTIVGERGVMLSGGQKQRISIARSLIKDPEILLLDEATSHLDTESEQLVQKALDKLMENRTTVVIAHRLSTVRKADLIIVIEDGKIVERGRHEELLNIPGIYRKMFEMQSL
ncbi:MAG: ABC transporter ATP-binding protein [Elusimicrobiota bacterium]